MPEVRFRSCTAHSRWPLVSQQKPSACTKGRTHPRFHSWPCVIFLLLWVSALKKKKTTKKNNKMLPNLMYDLSLSLCPHTSEKNGQSEFTEIIHISTYYVYKRLFSLSQWKCLFFQSCLSVSELVTYCVSTFPFFPHPCVFFCWCCLSGHSTAFFSGGLTSMQMFYMP